jgi:hypothetical protein
MNEKYTPENLSSYEEQLIRFKEIVISDVKGEADSELKVYLHNHIYIWLNALQNLRREVELQISCQTAKFKMDVSSPDLSESEVNEIKTNHYRWKMSVLKYLKHIESKTLYVKMFISDYQRRNKTLEA